MSFFNCYIILNVSQKSCHKLFSPLRIWYHVNL